MNISSVKHQKYNDELSDTVIATIDGQEMFIAKDEGNRHWVAIKAWVADGNTIDSAD